MEEAAIDLADRWRRARLSALRAGLERDEPPASEEELLPRALARAPDEVLRRVFEVSQTLGASFRHFHRLDLPLTDLAHLLPYLGTRCTARRWARVDEEPACVGERGSCRTQLSHPRTCDYWREAVHGLVLGLSSAVRFARQASIGHGDLRCVDVLYVHPQSPRRFGPLPDELRDGLESARRTACAFSPGSRVDLLGISENVLYFTCTTSGAEEVGVGRGLERAIQRRFPWLLVRDVSPRPVLGEGAA